MRGRQPLPSLTEPSAAEFSSRDIVQDLNRLLHLESGLTSAALREWLSLSLSLSLTHTHTHTHTQNSHQVSLPSPAEYGSSNGVSLCSDQIYGGENVQSWLLDSLLALFPTAIGRRGQFLSVSAADTGHCSAPEGGWVSCRSPQPGPSARPASKLQSDWTAQPVPHSTRPAPAAPVAETATRGQELYW